MVTTLSQLQDPSDGKRKIEEETTESSLHHKRTAVETPVNDHGYAREPHEQHAMSARRSLFKKNDQLTSNSSATQQLSSDDMETKLLKEMDGQLDCLCTKTESGSVLGKKLPPEELSEAAYEELRKRVPLLYRVLVTASWSLSSNKSASEPVIALIYAMLMRARNARMIEYQKILTAVSLRYNAGNQVVCMKLFSFIA